eukprot:6353305-Prymnesium_polylepis.1
MPCRTMRPESPGCSACWMRSALTSGSGQCSSESTRLRGRSTSRRRPLASSVVWTSAAFAKSPLGGGHDVGRG